MHSVCLYVYDNNNNNNNDNKDQTGYILIRFDYNYYGDVTVDKPPAC